jgi:hypothetical protein
MQNSVDIRLVDDGNREIKKDYANVPNHATSAKGYVGEAADGGLRDNLILGFVIVGVEVVGDVANSDRRAAPPLPPTP